MCAAERSLQCSKHHARHTKCMQTTPTQCALPLLPAATLPSAVCMRLDCAVTPHSLPVNAERQRCICPALQPNTLLMQQAGNTPVGPGRRHLHCSPAITSSKLSPSACCCCCYCIASTPRLSRCCCQQPLLSCQLPVARCCLRPALLRSGRCAWEGQLLHLEEGTCCSNSLSAASQQRPAWSVTPWTQVAPPPSPHARCCRIRLLLPLTLLQLRLQS